LGGAQDALKSLRLRKAMSSIGLALAGRADARLAQLMGISTSRTTLLRRVRDLPDPAATEPRAVGVDDSPCRAVTSTGPS
jgi:hypothetical protein